MNQLFFLLEKYMNQIRVNLGADWPEFAAEMQNLAPTFAAVQNETDLARAIGDLYMLCRMRKPVMNILRQAAEKHGIPQLLSDRRVQAGGADQPDEMPIREIANRFQSLLENLEEIEQPETDQSLRGQGRGQSTERTI